MENGQIVLEIEDGFLASGRVFHQLLDGQLVKELLRFFVGVLQPPFLPLYVPGCCPIHENHGARVLLHATPSSSSPCSCYPAILLLVFVCVCGGGGGDEKCSINTVCESNLLLHKFYLYLLLLAGPALALPGHVHLRVCESRLGAVMFLAFFNLDSI